MTNKKLEELANAGLIHPKKSTTYRKALEDSIKAKGWDYSKLHHPDEENDLTHDSLYFDMVELVNELAQTLLDEREQRKESITELKQEIKYFFEREGL